MDNNSNDNYNLNSSMNANAFDVFNQNANNSTPAAPQAPVTPQPVQNQNGVPVANITTTPPKPPVIQKQSSEPVGITVNDYVEPKEKFSFKNLMKKKVEEEEKKFDINAITQYTEEHKKEVDTEEVKEEKKKKKDLIKLILLLVALAVAMYFAYSIFSNYLKVNDNVINTISTKEPLKEVKTESYECNKPLDMDFYKLPQRENILLDNYKGKIIYTFKNDKLDSIYEELEIEYDKMTVNMQEVINYCNKYNIVYDQFQLLCSYKRSTIIIKNNMSLTKPNNKKFANDFLTFNLEYDKNAIVGDVLSNDKSCKLKQDV